MHVEPSIRNPEPLVLTKVLSAFRFATRSLLRWRSGAVVAALTLAIGIGMTTGLYALTRVLLADMRGVPELNRLARVYATSQTLGVERSLVALREFDSTLANANSFSAIGAYSDIDAMLGTGLNVRPVVAGYGSPAFFTAMGVPPTEGRVFTAEDVADPRNPVILSDALWHRQFPNGRIGSETIVVDGVERAVVGVMPPEFQYSFVGIGADLWVPLGRASIRSPAIVTVYARLRDGADWPAAQAELAALSPARTTGGQWTWRAIPIGDDARHRALAAYTGTLGLALLVLIVACVNVACLLLTRGFERDRELSVRRALGASRAGLIHLLLTENLLLAIVSGALGAALAVGILRVLAAQLAAFQPSLAARIVADVRLVPVVIAASALACLICGTAPAVRLSRRDVAASLNGVPSVHRIQIGGYGGRDVIVFAEIAPAVGLIVWVAMLYTLFAQIGAIRFAFPADRIVAMRVPARSVLDVSARVAAIPGVTHAAVASGMLGGGARMRVETGARSTVVSRVPVGDGFLETMGLPLVRGRTFDRSELHEHAAVAVLSESAAQQLAPGGNAVGMRLSASENRSVTVIGVCHDAIDYGALSKAGTDAPSELYVPYESPAISRESVVIARLSMDPHPALRAIAAAAETPAGATPVRPVVLSEEMTAGRDRNARGTMMMMKLCFAFALLTLLLAASGVFAVIGQSVAQRTREFGIRMAIGATPRRVLAMVLAREAKLIGLAIVVGLVFTLAITNALFVDLIRLNAIVPRMWLGALTLAGSVAAAALAFATYRIVRLEPAVVLRRS